MNNLDALYEVRKFLGPRDWMIVGWNSMQVGDEIELRFIIDGELVKSDVGDKKYSRFIVAFRDDEDPRHPVDLMPISLFRSLRSGNKSRIDKVKELLMEDESNNG